MATIVAFLQIGLAPRHSEQDDSLALVFAPPLETPLWYASTASIELELEQSELRLWGELQDRKSRGYWTRGLADKGDTIQISWSLLWQDTYHSVDEVRPLRFDRTWDEFELSMKRKGDALLGPTDLWLKSKLQGESARYTWKTGERAYRVFPRDGHEAFFADAVETLGTPLCTPVVLEERIPANAPEWSIDPMGFAAVIWPGGFGAFAHADVEPFVILPDLPPDPEFWQEGIEGRVMASVKSDRIQVGESLGVLQLEFELCSTRDRAGECRWTWKGGGELLWSKSRGALEVLQLDGEVGIHYDLEFANPFTGSRTEHSGALTEVWSGKLSVRTTAAR